jgi:ribonuclease HI
MMNARSRTVSAKMPAVEVFTDGACSGNPGPGGWGALLVHAKGERELSGGAASTTNNRMELTAAIEALRALKRPCRAMLYTDSRYLKDGITRWMAKWLANNWKTADRKPVKNQDLWRKLEEAMRPHAIEWHWVRSHAGHDGNERADRLARAACAKSLKAVSARSPRPKP